MKNKFSKTLYVIKWKNEPQMEILRKATKEDLEMMEVVL